MKRYLVLAVIVGFVAFGCAKKAVTPVQQPEEALKQPPQAREVEKPEKAPDKITEQQIAQVESKEIPPKVEEISGTFKDIHFDYDRYDIREDAKSILRSVSDYLIKNAALKMLVEGHCDARGTSEYNLGLGDRRARATKDYLLSLGVPSSRIETISYGKEKPLCEEHTEDCWTKNRRAHFVILKGMK